LARLNLASAKNSATFMTIVPVDDHLNMTDRNLRYQYKLRMDEPMSADMPELCSCGAALTTDHLFSCRPVSGWYWTLRHDRTKEAVAREGRTNSCAVIVEPPTEDHARVDATFSTATSTFATDFVVTHSLSPSYVNAVSRDAHHAVRAAEVKKRAHHERKCTA
jgi:hypothetical protein